MDVAYTVSVERQCWINDRSRKQKSRSWIL